ncbi:MAG TPA: tetratricopeptide repeat protein [Puia sp.]|nr:tetratricopeptide repeat protein [Puia sp.]
MKILLALLAGLLLEGFIQLHSPKTDPLAARRQALLYKQSNLIRCGADLTTFDPTADPIPFLSGWGDYRMPVTEKNDSAYLYFQQGINMYYGFHIIEALASFDKSTRFDSGFAMGYWGVALAYGPNINDNGYSANPAALAAAIKAKALSAHVSPAEKALIDAIQPRYSADSTQTREHLDQLYVDAMRTAYQQFPRDHDIAALYADALMQQHPWDLYDRYGKPKTWTPPIVAILEGILKTEPNHPGAAHYYIHAVEASDHPGSALDVAGRLPTLMPGVSHLVHMPAHIYIRTGNYDEGWRLNTLAVKGYYDYLDKYAPVSGNTPLYLIHNLHMQAACANMDGRYADAIKASIDTRASFDSSWMSAPDFNGVFMQYVYMTPLLTQVRFGKWDEILKDPVPATAYIYADVLSHYARGIALARKGQPTDAEQELQALQHDTLHPQLKAPAPNYANPGINGARVAERILAGVIAESRNQMQPAIEALRTAVEIEDAMIYDEPKDWQQPARQFLGAVYIKTGRYKEAEKAFREDLQINPNNGWSYTGLATALAKQGKKQKAATAAARAKKTFARSDLKITSAVL